MLTNSTPRPVVFLTLLVLGFLGCNKADEKQKSGVLPGEKQAERAANNDHTAGTVTVERVSKDEKQAEQAANNDEPPGQPGRSRFLFPKDPRKSLQPLAPGFSWTYNLVVKTTNPQTLRWYTEDAKSGSHMAIQGLFCPFDKSAKGTSKIRFTVMDEIKTFLKMDAATFHRIRIDDADSGLQLNKDEDLYWGRFQYGKHFDAIAICEVRGVSPVVRKFMESAKETGIEKLVHFRYLASAETLYDFPRPNQVMVSARKLSYKGGDGGYWSAKSMDTLEQIEVAAGKFSCVKTEFEFEGLNGDTVTETTYYSGGFGLVKLVQSVEGRENYRMDLDSHNLVVRK